MVYDKESLKGYLLFDEPIRYNDQITLYPVRMKDIVLFTKCKQSIIIRKDSVFPIKKILKMGYFEFLKYAHMNDELSEVCKEDYPNLKYSYLLSLQLLSIVCTNPMEFSNNEMLKRLCKIEQMLSDIKTIMDKDIKEDQNIEDIRKEYESQGIIYSEEDLSVFINGCEITNEIFDDLRRIIIIQNDIDFDIDEFMNIDTLRALEQAKAFEERQTKNEYELEDYIDSLAIGLGLNEEYIMNLTVRKFWRYIKRMIRHEDYQAAHQGEMTGFVSFKEPLTHWMTTLEVEDKYANQKANENELRSKMG